MTARINTGVSPLAPVVTGLCTHDLWSALDCAPGVNGSWEVVDLAPDRGSCAASGRREGGAGWPPVALPPELRLGDVTFASKRSPQSVRDRKAAPIEVEIPGLSETVSSFG